ncbi:MAG: MgtC/SapB family protein, partial [bacterium]|nr:MgtC/SapB family protein [bacterium]
MKERMIAVHEVFEFLRQFNYVTILIRLTLALIAGGIIGTERGKHGSAAGLRTHILVCIGSAMTALTGYYVYDILNIEGDVLRLAAQVISGIGFLGAGMIFVQKYTIKGL